VIQAKLDLSMDVIRCAVEEYHKKANPFYEASYDLIKSKSVWDNFNQNWIDKLILVYSWMPLIAGKNLKLKIDKGESLDACIQRNCKKEVLDSSP
jgi:hypothetical protein